MQGRDRDERDYYALLAVTRAATCTDIKRAYRRALLRSHPDKRRADGECGEEAEMVPVALLKEAYETLSETEARARYDSALSGSRGGGGGRGNGKKSTPRPAQIISLDEFAFEENSGWWTHLCRCGGAYKIGNEELDQGVHLVGCGSCSECVWVGYEVEVEGAEREMGSGSGEIIDRIQNTSTTIPSFATS
jgi:diphthamide biosynthesis protein 4